MKNDKKVTLPQWLDKVIFDEFEAIYEPRPSEVVYNPDKSHEFVKIYLGTYFPRSYSEAYCIVSKMLCNSIYKSQLECLDEIHILDFCCGTGGELVGLIDILQSQLPKLKKITIDAFDANPDAITFLYHLMEYINNSEEITIRITINPQCLFVSSEQELLDLVHSTNFQYHFILSFKALNEFIQHKTFGENNVYSLISSYLMPLLSSNGIFILSDVTTKNDDNGYYYPILLNRGINTFIRNNTEYKSIYPFPCFHYENKCNGCYMQDVFSISHRKKTDDISRVAYRILAHKQFAEIISTYIASKKCRATDMNVDKNEPYK